MSTSVVRGNVRALYVVQVTYNPANITGTATTTEQDIPVSGVAVNDICIGVSKPSHSAGVTIGNVRVKAADTISIQWANPTVAAVDPGSETYTIVMVRPELPIPSIVNIG